jgi:tRNA(Ile)-lysidine synthase
METSDFDFENLYSIFESSITSSLEKNSYDEFLIAYSGGCDSTALLYFANQIARKNKINIRAIHINHNLNKESKKWENHCKEFCKEINVDLYIENINIILKPGDSLEEQAREERYSSIYSQMNKKTLMMTAHHGDDQAETFLYQLFRGSGAKGLSSMPRIKKIKKGFHLRPFLAFNKKTLEDFVELKALRYVEDLSNNNTDFSRNFIRKEILPNIKMKWPSCASTISRSAQNLSELFKLNEDLAMIDIQNFLINDACKLSISVRSLEKYRCNNVIRHWISKNNYRMPSSEQMHSIYSNVLNAGRDKVPFFLCSEYEIRRHNDYIEIMQPLQKHDSSSIYKWKLMENLIITNLSLNLSWTDLEKRFGRKIDHDVEVRFRKTGENIKLYSSKKSLKDYMREINMPPWKRERTPLIYINKELRVIWD